MRKVLAAGAALMALAAPARAEWRVYEARHFQIYSESGEARAAELATRLERYDKLMRMATNTPDEAPTKVRIFEVPSTDEIEKALGVSNTTIAGFYNSNVFGPYLVTPRRVGDSGRYFTPMLVLQHEYAHHFMLNYFPATYPQWYVEGFAELIGSSTMEKDGSIRYGEPARQRGNQLVTYWVPLQELFAKDRVDDFDNYGQGWAMTHYLTMDPARARQLRTYLQQLNAGKPNREAATAAFGDLAKLNADIRLHVQKGQWVVRPVTPTIASPVLTGSRAMTPAEVALMPEMLAFDDEALTAYKGSERTKEAARRRALLARTRDKAARFPADPYALSFLAEVAALNDDMAEIDRATSRLLAIQPNHVRGLVRRSLFLARQAAAAPAAQRAAGIAEARAMALRANKLDPDDAMPLFAYYQSFRLVGEPAKPGAVKALESAALTLPDNDEVRMALVEEYAGQKRYAAAIRVIGPIANSPHDSPQRDAARERMAQLRALAGTAPAAPAAAS